MCHNNKLVGLQYFTRFFYAFSFRAMFVAGEHCDVQTMDWIRAQFKVPVLDNWWQTGQAYTKHFNPSSCRAVHFCIDVSRTAVTYACRHIVLGFAETGSPITSSCAGLTANLQQPPIGTAGKPVPGWNCESYSASYICMCFELIKHCCQVLCLYK